MSKKFPMTLHLAITLAWMVIALYLIFLYAPEELTMGEVQRIFYIHFSLAMTALFGYFFVFLGSIGYLWKRSRPADDFAHACAEVGFVFCCGVLVTGPLWAKPVWGIWWTWDPRLTATFIVWLLYIAYLMLRAYISNPARVQALAGVVGTLGFITSIVDYMAIRWWRTQHPQPVIGGGPDSGLDPRMWLTVFVTWGAFLCLFFYLVRVRTGISRARRALSLARHQMAVV
ncbi:MAG TPA: cytochrome c biogenesis protein CcsA [Terriglobia bacterium]|jgi:heme exporter protein C|nr:cytochrome c biogenesis protein CcsA [Terriglobia bacterium]